MQLEEINKMKNRIFSLERQVERQNGTISLLESQAGKIVDDADISHESLKWVAKKLTSDVVFRCAIEWYRDQLNKK